MTEITAEPPRAVVPKSVRYVRVLRYVGWAVLALAVAFALSWVGWKAASEPATWIVVTMNGITLGGLFFILASGFTLMFGLMRVVNMAHGALYLLGGYIAFEVQEAVGTWGIPALAGAISIALIALFIQQAFLRWNQGQEIRQAMITIAISIILADQMLGAFGGASKDIKWPEALDFSVSLGAFGLSYPFVRIFIVLCALAIGLGLWAWLQKTRIGMIIRAGVDDRAMVSALGINIQLVFALSFAIGGALAGYAGVLGGSLTALGPGEDIGILVNSLIVVIIGGLGSLGGAALGALLLGLVDSYADVYLPVEYTNYGVMLVFALLVLVLAIRPLGFFGRPS